MLAFSRDSYVSPIPQRHSAALDRCPELFPTSRSDVKCLKASRSRVSILSRQGSFGLDILSLECLFRCIGLLNSVEAALGSFELCRQWYEVD